MEVAVKTYHKIAGVYSIELDGITSLATLNIIPGKAVYGEQLVQVGEKNFRLWDPFRSKLAAAILKGLTTLPIKVAFNVLYLGAASGTTVSHVSDIIGVKGRIYAVEFSPRSLRELIRNLSSRLNVIPILADARSPQSYRFLVENSDLIYCDVAQPQQARILADNADIFLKEGGLTLFAIKARSIDSTRNPEKIFKEEINKLNQRGFKVEKIIPLEPYDRDHVMVLAKK